jgi:hypothetical protein
MGDVVALKRQRAGCVGDPYKPGTRVGDCTRPPGYVVHGEYVMTRTGPATVIAACCEQHVMPVREFIAEAGLGDGETYVQTVEAFREESKRVSGRTLHVLGEMPA